jgi:hypothetical protein
MKAVLLFGCFLLFLGPIVLVMADDGCVGEKKYIEIYVYNVGGSDGGGIINFYEGEVSTNNLLCSGEILVTANNSSLYWCQWTPTVACRHKIIITVTNTSEYDDLSNNIKEDYFDIIDCNATTTTYLTTITRLLTTTTKAPTTTTKPATTTTQNPFPTLTMPPTTLPPNKTTTILTTSIPETTKTTVTTVPSTTTTTRPQIISIYNNDTKSEIIRLQRPNGTLINTITKCNATECTATIPPKTTAYLTNLTFTPNKGELNLEITECGDKLCKYHLASNTTNEVRIERGGREIGERWGVYHRNISNSEPMLSLYQIVSADANGYINFTHPLSEWEIQMMLFQPTTTTFNPPNSGGGRTTLRVLATSMTMPSTTQPYQEQQDKGGFILVLVGIIIGVMVIIQITKPPEKRKKNEILRR